MFSQPFKRCAGVAILAAIFAVCSGLLAQDQNPLRDNTKLRPGKLLPTSPGRKAPYRSATIDWQRLPLRDAIGRLHTVFNETVFVDRRVDPSQRVTLDIEAGSAEEVVAAIAAVLKLSETRLGPLIYLGPAGAAEQLQAVAISQSRKIASVSADLRTSLERKRSFTWPRPSEPRAISASVIEQRGWRLANEEQIPHDIWPAGEFPQMTLAQELTLLLIGFDLTFELKPDERSIQIVELKDTMKAFTGFAAGKQSAAPPNAPRAKTGGRQVFTLRVKEKPVRAVLQELSNRLHWVIQIDEDSIKAAGKSLDEHVSFTVENADRERLLDALLQPAGLDYHLEGDVVRIIPLRYGDK